MTSVRTNYWIFFFILVACILYALFAYEDKEDMAPCIIVPGLVLLILVPHMLKEYYDEGHRKGREEARKEDKDED